jgi:hypothetical protein
MEQTARALTAERYATGMTFEAYLKDIATPENLAREGNLGTARADQSGQMTAWYESLTLTDYQVAALRWLAAQSGGPANVLVIAEEWSSDCRRDLPVAARMAEAANLELRVFRRDGERFSRASTPSPEESPNADLMANFLNHKNGETWQSIPVVAFYTANLDYLYHYTEFPAIYDKARLVTEHIRGARRGETRRETLSRGDREFEALVASPFFRLWAGAAVDEMISALHRRLVLGAV